MLDDDNYRLLQLALLQDSERGTSGPEVILMLMIYAKTEQDDLTAQQKRVIRQLIERERR